MINKIYSFILKICRVIKANLFFKGTVILYKHKNFVHIIPIAIIKNASYKNIKDILYFQNRKYIEVFRTFLDAGDKGYFAYLNGKCVHRSWVQFGEKEVEIYRFLKRKIEKDEAFIHYCETAPEARGKNIYPTVLSKIVTDLKDKYKNIYISTNIKNKASRRGIEKAGFRERVHLLIILGIKIKRTLRS